MSLGDKSRAQLPGSKDSAWLFGNALIIHANSLVVYSNKTRRKLREMYRTSVELLICMFSWLRSS
jgi:hypothetical protein